MINKNKGMQRGRRHGVDLGWDEPAAPAKGGHSLWLLACGGIGVAAVVCLVVWMAATKREPPVAVAVTMTEPSVSPADRAAKVARVFVAASDVEERLTLVRAPEIVRGHLQRYPEQARSGAVENLRKFGHSVINGVKTTSFAARFADGSSRMLSVVDEGKGPLVDWDGYARYTSAPWSDLVNGLTAAGEARVFVHPGEHFGGRFLDAERWVCFLLRTPDFEGSLYAYAPTGSDLAKRIKSAVMATRNFRQRMTLQIKAEGDGLFEVEALLAVGWVVLK